MSKIRVYSYKQGSQSARKLSESVKGKVLRLVGSKYKPRQGDVVVNWGAGVVPQFANAVVLNKDTSKASCKLRFFQAVKDKVNHPPFWTNKKDIPDDAYPVCCRTKLAGHSAEGLVIANTKEELVDAKLYTKYIKKVDEYRVHVFQGKAFFIQRKARKLDVENPNWQIRNLANGFVFCEQEIAEIKEDIIKQSIITCETLGLDFGGVDVIWNNKEGKAYVLEVNTACGLEERTAEAYAGQIRNLVAAV